MPSKYDEDDHADALRAYERAGRNLSRVAEDPLMPSRPTLVKWKQQGLGTPDGTPWDDYLDEKQEQALQEATEDAELSEVRWDGDSVESALEDDLKQLYTEMRQKMRVSSRVPTPSDIERIGSLILDINKSEQERIAWMQRVATRIVGAIVDEISDSQLTRIKSKIMRELAEEESQLRR
jgi:hypothetical protein